MRKKPWVDPDSQGNPSSSSQSHCSKATCIASSPKPSSQFLSVCLCSLHVAIFSRSEWFPSGEKSNQKKDIRMDKAGLESRFRQRKCNALFLCKGGVISLSVCPDRGDIVSEPLCPSKGVVLSVPIYHNERGVASVPFYPSEGDVVFVPICPCKGSMLSVSIFPPEINIKLLLPHCHPVYYTKLYEL